MLLPFVSSNFGVHILKRLIPSFLKKKKNKSIDD